LRAKEREKLSLKIAALLFYSVGKKEKESRRRRKLPSFFRLKHASPRIERLIVCFLGTPQNKKRKKIRGQEEETRTSLSLSLSVRERKRFN
jgi:hypothetical protein